MIDKLNNIVLYTLFAFGVSLLCYPLFIRFLKHIKANKTLRIDAASGGKAQIFNQLHAHKAGIPTMG